MAGQRLWQGNHYGPQFNHFHSVQQTVFNDKDECRVLLESLTFERMGARLRNVATALPNTCQWIQRHQDFLAWADSSRVQEHGSCLWIKGKPGSGKSTVMKTLVAWAEKNWTGELLLTYFFNARLPSELEKSSLGLYRSSVYQFLTVDRDSQTAFARVFAPKERDGTLVEDWTQIELQNSFVEVVMNGRQQSINLFIDALDEGEDGDVRRMVDYVEHLVTSLASTGICIRVCLASRHYPYITVRKNLTITLEDQAEHEHDIDHYIDTKLLVEHKQHRDLLRKKVRDRSAGVFLWVILVVAQLNQLWDRGRTINSMLDIINETPQYLSDLFDTTFARHLENIDECLVLLRWVLFSRRPLRPIELYVAVQNSCGMTVEDAEFPPHGAVERYITDCSRGLVETTTFGRPTVQFIHETVREFLTNKTGPSEQHSTRYGRRIISHSFRSEECHMKVAEECLQYFIWHVPKGSLHHVNQPALALYAAEPWWQHVHASNLACSPQILHLAYELLTTDSALLSWMKHLERKRTPTWIHEDHEYDPDSPLYYAAAIGMTDLVRMLLDQGAQVNGRRTRHRSTPLRVASMGGYSQTVQVLLDYGADFNAAEAVLWGPALIAASEGGHTEIVQMLLKAGADVNSQAGIGAFHKTALQAAAYLGHVQIARILLEAGADIHAGSALNGSVMQRACEGGHVQVVELLFEYNADANEIGGIFRYPLLHACYGGHEQIVQALVRAGANVNVEVEVYGAPLYAAAHADNIHIVQILLDHGANVNARGAHYTDALQAACSNGNVRMVQMLLDHGADVNAKAGRLGTALEIARGNGDDELCRILRAYAGPEHAAEQVGE